MHPNITTTTLGGTVQFTTNSQGWRDVEHSFIKPDGVFRILVLGDSYMEGGTVNLDEQFSRQLETVLKTSKYPGVEVISMGVSGYGTLQEDLVFEQYGKLYHPDLVLVAFYPDNDLIDNSLELTRLASGADLTQFYRRPFLLPGTDADWQIQAPNPLKQAAAAKTTRQSRPIWQHSALYNLIARSVLVAQGTDITNMLFLCQQPAIVEDSWQTTSRIFQHLDAQVQQAGARLAIFTVPSRAATDPAFTKLMLRGVSDTSQYCYVDAPPYKHLSSLGQELGIPADDLLLEFREISATQGVALSLTGENAHWNAQGHRVAAQLVAQFLVQQHLLPQVDGASK